MNAQVFAHLGSAADFSDDSTLYRLATPLREREREREREKERERRGRGRLTTVELTRNC